MTGKSSFTNISSWFHLLNESNANPNLQTFLVANKINLEIDVSTEEVKKLAEI